MRKLSKLVSLMLSVVLCIGMASPALAVEYDISKGAVTVDSTGSNGVIVGQTTSSRNDFTEEDRSITISQSGEGSTSNTIAVGEGVTDTTIILNGVNIDVSKKTEAAMSISGEKTDVTVELKGKNTLNGGPVHAGLELSDRGSVTITSENKGELTATGGSMGAGIGSGKEGNAGNIAIEGNAQVTATGSRRGAGIGSGIDGTAGNITIEGNAAVTATGGDFGGAGIGSGGSYYNYVSNSSGSGSSVGDIIIKGNAQVTATGGLDGAGIGSGGPDVRASSTCKAGNITIEGNAVVTATGGDNGAGIGSSHQGAVESITIKGEASVTAMGGWDAAGIGGGRGRPSSVGPITIEGAKEVTAIGGQCSAGIGGGGWSTVGDITIKDAKKITATGGRWDGPVSGGAGIGGGYASAVGDITVSGKGNFTIRKGEGALQDIGKAGAPIWNVIGKISVQLIQEDGSLYYQKDDSEFTFTPPVGKEIKVNDDGRIDLPAGTASVDKDGNTQVLCTNAVISEDGKPTSDAHDYQHQITEATCTKPGEEADVCIKCGDKQNVNAIPATGRHTPGEAVRENEVEGSYDEVVYCSVCGGEISREQKTEPLAPPEAPDVPGTIIPDLDIPMADGTGTDTDTTTIADQEVPLAGLVSRQILVSALYVRAGSPDGEDAEGEYVKALAWAVANGIIDAESDSEEVVTVAILRDVMTRYARFLDVAFDVDIPGEDDEIVMNCNEILEKFFAAQEDKAA